MPIFAEFSDRAQPFMSTSPRGQQWLKNTRSVDEQIADAVRADSDTAGDGLRMTIRHDESGRPIKEFQNIGSRKVWMDKWRAPLQEQVAIHTSELPRDQFPAVERKWREDRAIKAQAAADLARGVDVRFDLLTGVRVS